MRPRRQGDVKAVVEIDRAHGAAAGPNAAAFYTPEAVPGDCERRGGRISGVRLFRHVQTGYSGPGS